MSFDRSSIGGSKWPQAVSGERSNGRSVADDVFSGCHWTLRLQHVAEAVNNGGLPFDVVVLGAGMFGLIAQRSRATTPNLSVDTPGNLEGEFLHQCYSATTPK